MRVVLVDDNQDLRVLWRLLLESSSSFEVVGQAADGFEGLAMCREHRPDAVVTDWRMPDLDGLGLARRLLDEHPDLVVVLCSAYPHSNLPPEVDDLGVIYLNKMDSGQLPDVLAGLMTTKSESTGDDPGGRTPLVGGPCGGEPPVPETKMMIPQARLRLQQRLGREPNRAELAGDTGISEALISLHWDEAGTGAVPTWLLDRWVGHIDDDPHLDEDPAVVVLVRALLRVALEVSDGYLELIRLLARANAAPEAEMARLKLLWTKWTMTLGEALARHGVPSREAETAAKRAIIVLWDAVTRWGANGHRGHYGPFLREALLAQIPEAILVLDELTDPLPEWRGR